MAYVGNKPDVNYTSFQKQDLTGATGGTLTLSTPVTNANDIQLFINHVRQESGSSYVASGTTVTLQGYTVSASDDIYVIYHQAFQTTQPPDGSVGTAKIADDAVTTAKLANSLLTLQGLNMVYAHSKLDTSTTIGSSTTTLGFGGTSSNESVTVDTSNDRLTPTVSGTYLVCVTLTCSADGGANGWTPNLGIRKNGSGIAARAAIRYYSGGHSADFPFVMTVASMNGSSDYFDFYASQNSGATLTQNSGSVFTLRLGD